MLSAESPDIFPHSIIEFLGGVIRDVTWISEAADHGPAGVPYLDKMIGLREVTAN